MWTPLQELRRNNKRMRAALWLHFVRLTVSVGLATSLIVVCLRIPHIYHATVGLLLVLLVVGIATVWGAAEALIAALAGGLGFDYYFLPPHGFGVEDPEHWFVLAAFLITAVVTGQLTARSKERRIAAEEHQEETEKLYELVNTLLDTGSSDSGMGDLAPKMVEIFNADGVAIYDKRSEQIVRAGPLANRIPDRVLRDAATHGLETTESMLSVTPIRHGSHLAGSIGIHGSGISVPLLTAISARVGMGLARMYAIERSTEAEVARRSEELKAAVLDALAHEIRSPLNSIKMAATTLLSGRSVSDSIRREMLTVIDEEADRMDRFIDESIQLARMEANELSLCCEPQDVSRLIPAAVEGMGALTSQRNIVLRVPDFLPPAKCDWDMILRVLKQLLNNALKYSPEGSELTISASANFSGSAIVIDVVDCGPGVAEDERDRIFEKYYRGRAARRATQGTGLGLASAKCIVEAHGGEIWVTSAPSGGAAFHVSLPVSSTSHPVGAA